MGLVLPAIVVAVIAAAGGKKKKPPVQAPGAGGAPARAPGAGYTKADVERLQRAILATLGPGTLGTYGEAGDGVDGSLGPVTCSALQALLAADMLDAVVQQAGLSSSAAAAIGRACS